MSVAGKPNRGQTARWLRACARVGENPVLDGKPTVLALNRGRIEVGDRFMLSSQPVPSHMVSFGMLHIGDDVSIGHGSAVAASLDVSIGSRSHIGPFFVLMDTDFHGERARSGARHTTNTAMSSESGYGRVRIGSDVRIGAHVTVLRGATIGDGATIGNGSVVNGTIPAGSYAQGVPARVASASASAQDAGSDVVGIVARVFGLSARPDLHSGPDEIPQWDSFGSLKLLLSLEEALGITLDEKVIAAVRSVADLQAAVERAQRREALAR
jgi:acetyltransferase-like isoleucine patch superfamily enzyme/acyl carrier protein